MKLHLRKPWWLTLDKLKERSVVQAVNTVSYNLLLVYAFRYAELSSTIDVALKELVDSGFVDSESFLRISIADN